MSETYSIGKPELQALFDVVASLPFSKVEKVINAARQSVTDLSKPVSEPQEVPED